MKPFDVNVSSYELASTKDDKYGRLSEELNNGQSPCHTQLSPKPLHQYRWMTWTNGLTIFGAFCLCGACVGGICFGIGASGERGGVFTYDSLCGANEVTTFAINSMLTESLTFEQVKALDALCNLVFGRGFQVLFGWLGYHIFGMATLRILQDSTVPLPFLRAMAFETTSVKTIYYQYQALYFIKSLRARITLLWLAISVLFLTFMPTLLDLSTGYMATTDPMINVSTNITLTKLVPFELQSEFEALWAVENNRTKELFNGNGADHVCSVYLSEFGGTTKTCPQNVTIQDHVFTVSDIVDSSGQWRMNTTETPDGYLKCVPSSAYAWGFSSGYTLIFSVLTLLWVIGMCSVWFDTMRFGHLWHSGRGFGHYRNVIDIAYHLEQKLGPDTCAYSHAELEKAIEKLPPVGLEVVCDGEYGTIRLSENPGGHDHLSRAQLQYGRPERVSHRKVATWPLST